MALGLDVRSVARRPYVGLRVRARERTAGHDGAASRGAATLRDPEAATPQPRRGQRADIQALRALAVSLVLIFHLQPSLLTGGYVGVDVFFVISGFLITSHLLSSPPRTVSDLLLFWSRRIARLLPAAMLVLVTTLVASRVIGPETQWGETSDDVAAAGFYVVNWRFADQAVDYLASEAAPSPVQHYWSLSVEEQFYAGWPVLLLLLFGIGTYARVADARRRLLLLTGLGTVTGASLIWSMHLTASEPARAYFVTSTRIWELGVGGVLATALMWRVSAGPAVANWRAALALGGFAVITWAAVTYTRSTPFPGWHALVPVLGTAMVIAAAAGGRLGRCLAVGPVQFVGDVSYSIYLWHWPLIVLVPAATHRELNVLDKVAIVAVTLVLAAASKRYVEDPFRRPLTAHPIRIRYAGAATGMAVLVGLTTLQGWEVGARELDARHELSLAASSQGSCFGAAALADRACSESPTPAIGSAAQAALDKSQAYPQVPGGQNCFSYKPGFATVRCDFGSDHPSATIALVGNSHAGHWLPALQSLAEQRNWHVTTFLASECALSEVPQEIGTEAQTQACLAWVQRTTADVVNGKFDAVVVSDRVSVPVPGKTIETSGPDYQRGYGAVLRTWSKAGVPVLGIRDTPAPVDGGVKSIPDCLSNGGGLSSCAGDLQSWLPADPFVAAAKATHSRKVHVVDLTDRFCEPTTCNPVVGGVVVYFDGEHLTATYSRTLAPYLEPAVTRILRAGTGSALRQPG